MKAFNTSSFNKGLQVVLEFWLMCFDRPFEMKNSRLSQQWMSPIYLTMASPLYHSSY